jgi:hypothetical protein
MIPRIGALIAAGLTVSAWLVLKIGSHFPLFRGEGGYVLPLLTLPVMWLGFVVTGLIGRCLSLDFENHAVMFNVIVVISTIITNMSVSWIVLRLLMMLFGRKHRSDVK